MEEHTIIPALWEAEMGGSGLKFILDKKRTLISKNKPVGRKDRHIIPEASSRQMH
jgi:hypothetical protein